MTNLAHSAEQGLSVAGNGFRDLAEGAFDVGKTIVSGFGDFFNWVTHL